MNRFREECRKVDFEPKNEQYRHDSSSPSKSKTVTLNYFLMPATRYNFKKPESTDSRKVKK